MDDLIHDEEAPKPRLDKSGIEDFVTNELGMGKVEEGHLPDMSHLSDEEKKKVAHLVATKALKSIHEIFDRMQISGKLSVSLAETITGSVSTLKFTMTRKDEDDGETF